MPRVTFHLLRMPIWMIKTLFVVPTHKFENTKNRSNLHLLRTTLRDLNTCFRVNERLKTHDGRNIGAYSKKTTGFVSAALMFDLGIFSETDKERLQTNRPGESFFVLICCVSGRRLKLGKIARTGLQDVDVALNSGS